MDVLSVEVMYFYGLLEINRHDKCLVLPGLLGFEEIFLLFKFLAVTGWADLVFFMAWKLCAGFSHFIFSISQL